ncbi:MAG: cell division protein FtsA [Ahrensia sp.]|nr:cell division protein FtsA [Ahrensia sp.]
MAKTRSSIITVLDIGSTKTVCVIARLSPIDGGKYLHGRTHAPEVIGIGHTKSLGMKSGVIVDLDGIERSIRHAVEAAERMANLTVDSIITNIGAGRIKSTICTASIALSDRPISSSDINKVLQAAVARAARVDRQVVHLMPVDHMLDGERGIIDPRGMIGAELSLNMHLLSVDAAPMRNIETAINRAHLGVEQMVATPYASGLATLVDDELELGCACIDMGGGTTSISVFSERKFIYADSIPVGGHHVTMDIARGFSCGIDDAERFKVMQGSVILSSVDDRDMIAVPGMGEDGIDNPLHVSRSLLNRIIAARVEETLEMLRDRLNKSGHSSVIGKRVVLTGGAAQMNGLPDLARRILGRNVRIGRPLGIKGLPTSAKTPAFASAIGLMIYPQAAHNDQSFTNFSGVSRSAGTGTNGALSRVSQWIKESF